MIANPAMATVVNAVAMTRTAVKANYHQVMIEALETIPEPSGASITAPTR
jgi:hypothetical protein